jgi:hypothetical protein
MARNKTKIYLENIVSVIISYIISFVSVVSPRAIPHIGSKTFRKERLIFFENYVTKYQSQS